MFFFFFSSRRRHTRCSRDWSSDVCSSDLLRHRLEAVAVVPRRTEPVNRVQVLGRRVALVRFPEIAGVGGGQPVHEVIAQDLGDDGRRRDRVAAGIAIHDGFVLAPELGTWQPIDEHVGGDDAEPSQRPLHRKDRGAADIEPIDLPNAGRPHRHGEGALTNLDGELLALERREDLRIVQPADRLHTHRKHDGRGDHWACQWTAADFIDSGDDAPTFAPQRRLAFQRWAAVSHVCVGSCSAVPPVGTVIPRFSRILAALPASRRRKYSLARRTRPFRNNPISAINGACSGKIRSTPTPAEILRTVNVSLIPPPRRAMQIPSNAWSLSFSPSRTRTITRTVSPGAKAGMLSRRFSMTTCSSRRSFPINPVSAHASGAWLAPPAMPQSCRGRHSTIRPGRRARDSWAAACSWAAPIILRNASHSTPIHDPPARRATAVRPRPRRPVPPAPRPTAQNRRSRPPPRPSHPRRVDR